MKEPRKTITEMDILYSKGTNIRAVALAVTILLSLLSLFLYFSQSSKPLSSASAVETEHLIVRSLGDDKLEINEFASELEADFADLLDKLQLQRTTKVIVDIYPNMEEFNRFFGNQSLEFPSIPVLMSANRISIVLPSAQNPDYDMTSINKVIKHTWTHFLINQIQSSPDIKWLNESMALYYGGQKNDPNSISLAVRKGYPTIDDLNRQRYSDLSSFGYTLSEFIVNKWGEESLVELLAFNCNTQQALKISKQEFENEWHQFIEQKYVK